jgi:hypothetical protein
MLLLILRSDCQSHDTIKIGFKVSTRKQVAHMRGVFIILYLFELQFVGSPVVTLFGMFSVFWARRN